MLLTVCRWNESNGFAFNLYFGSHFRLAVFILLCIYVTTWFVLVICVRWSAIKKRVILDKESFYCFIRHGYNEFGIYPSRIRQIYIRTNSFRIHTCRQGYSFRERNFHVLCKGVIQYRIHIERIFDNDLFHSQLLKRKQNRTFYMFYLIMISLFAILIV